MKVKILYDSESVNKELSVGWGFSCLVDGRVLFDLGSKAGSLLKNFNKMNLSLDSLESIVISHDHWDHTGGLEDILGQKKKLRVYICPGFSDSLKEKILTLPGNFIVYPGHGPITTIEEERRNKIIIDIVIK